MKTRINLLWVTVFTASLLFTSCPQPTVSSTPASTQNPPPASPVLNSAYENLSIPQIIAKGTDSIDLPTSSNGVTISWASSKPTIISTAGNVTHQAGEGTDTVSLTATLTYSGQTKTKTFDVTVYQKDATLSDDDILNAALEQVNLSDLTGDAPDATKTIDLPASTTVDDKTVNLTYTDSEDSHFSVNGTALTVTQDIVDISASLTVTATYNGKTKTKAIGVTIPRVSEFEKEYAYEHNSEHYSESHSEHSSISLDGTILTGMYSYTHYYHDEDGTENTSNGNIGYTYGYIANTQNQTLTATLHSAYDADADKWYPFQDDDPQLQPTTYTYKIEATQNGERWLKTKALYDEEKPWYAQTGEYISENRSSIYSYAIGSGTPHIYVYLLNEDLPTGVNVQGKSTVSSDLSSITFTPYAPDDPENPYAFGPDYEYITSGYETWQMDINSAAHTITLSCQGTSITFSFEGSSLIPETETVSDPTPPEPSDPGEPSDPVEETLNAAYENLSITQYVANETNSISLPTSSNGVTISWTSNRPTIISTAGNVTHQDGTGTDTVNLTATLTYSGQTKTKTFNVTVEQYPSALDTAYNNLSIPQTVANGTNSIDLPTSSNGVTISWTSNKPTIISTTGSVTHQDGNGIDSVTLVATLKSGNFTKQKTFYVSVYQNNATLSDDTILTTALEQVTLSDLTGDAPDATKTIYLPASTNVDGKTVSLTYTDSGDSHFRVSETTLTVTQDIVDISTSLTVTATYNGKTNTKTIDATIPLVSEFEKESTHEYIEGDISNYYTVSVNEHSKISLNGTILTMWHTRSSTPTDPSDVNMAYKYSYIVDTQNKTLTVTVDSAYDEETDTWYTPQDTDALEDLYRQQLASMEPDQKEYTIQMLKNEGYDFNEDDDEAILAAMMQYLDDNDPQSQSYTYTYKIEAANGKRWLYIEALYDEEKLWYEQSGYYTTQNGSIIRCQVMGSYVNFYAYLSHYDLPENVSVDGYATISQDLSSITFTPHAPYDGSNPDYEYITSGYETWQLSQGSEAHTITLSCEGTEGTSITFTFEGDALVP